MTNRVRIKEELYLSVSDEFVERGPGVEVCLKDQSVESSKMITYVLEHRGVGPISLLVSRDYDPFVCTLYDAAGKPVDLNPLGTVAARLLRLV